LGNAAMVPARLLSNATACLLFLRIVRSRNLFLPFTVLTSANLANAVNLIASPRGVIDFVHVDVLVRGSANFADYAMMGALWVLLIFLPLRLAVAILRSLRPGCRPSFLAWIDRPLVPEQQAQPPSADLRDDP
jgi:hypothetical protein